MSHFIRHFVMLSGLSLFILTVQAGEPNRPVRLALVIGNAAYAEKPLKNPVNDAKDMAKVLEGLGFQVVLKTDVNLRTMRDAVRDFVEDLSNGEVGLFYFSGHGNQYNGNNYLIPLGAKISEESDFQYEALGVMDVLERIQGKNKEGVNVIILDACRSNPFGGKRFKSGGTSKGLTLMGSPSGSLIVYATAPNEVADDNPAERNGIYTKHLLAVLRETPQENIFTLLTKVRQLVYKETQGKQIPREENSLMVSEFCLATTGCERVATQPPVKVTESTPSQLPTAVCPDTPAGVAVDKDGCPLDSDHDGVPDYFDECPDTPPTTIIDEDGCPTLGVNEELSIELEVLFDTNKVIVKPQYFDNVKKVADFMRQYPDISAEIEGHTDSKEGSAALTKKLSQRRADAVREVLISKFGVEASRLRAIGYGKDRPVADNKTEAGRQMNRRTVAVVRAMVQKQPQPESAISPLPMAPEPETTLPVLPLLPPLPRERSELEIVDQDQQQVKLVLEEKHDGQKVAWKNPNTNNEFEVTPTNTYKSRLGVCRDYEIVATIGGQREVSYNRACRQPGGYWKLVPGGYWESVGN